MPELASASRLSVFSPCRGAGSASYASGVDIDGEAWANPPSIGCDEYHAGAVTGPLSAGIVVTFTNVAVGFPVGLTAWIEGRTTLSLWDLGDGTLALDQPHETHAWTAPGDYLVTLWAFNDSHPEGASATVTIHVEQGLHYVAADSTNPVPPYTSWATAATNIQDAVDAAAVGGTVLVTNGTYGAGGRGLGSTMTNRVAVYKPLAARPRRPGLLVRHLAPAPGGLRRHAPEPGPGRPPRGFRRIDLIASGQYHPCPTREDRRDGHGVVPLRSSEERR